MEVSLIPDVMLDWKIIVLLKTVNEDKQHYTKLKLKTDPSCLR